MLNKSKGNMYSFVTHTWNAIKGKCPHDCIYCYMKKFREPNPIHFDKKELRTDLGENNFIFVGSSCDMWAWDIDWWWIHDILDKCERASKNKYLFQSKNPKRFKSFYGQFPHDIMFATTIETNREDYIIKFGGSSPTISDRYCNIHTVGKKDGAPTMISIEPIMDFDLDPMVEMIEDIEPVFVSIGANTNFNVKLPEPSPAKVRDLIEALSEFTEVKSKNNLRRKL